MQDWIELVNKQGTFKVETIMEIGSMNGYDADELTQAFQPERTFIIEAHPVFAKAISETFPEFYVCDMAASDSNKEITFNAVAIDSDNLGMSSMLDREDGYPSHNVIYEPVTVQAIRMDLFCDVNKSEISLIILSISLNESLFGTCK